MRFKHGDQRLRPVCTFAQRQRRGISDYIDQSVQLEAVFNHLVQRAAARDLGFEELCVD